MTIRKKGEEPSRQIGKQPTQPSAQPGIRFIMLLIAVVCVGACAWGVVAMLHDGKAVNSYFEGVRLQNEGKAAQAREKFIEAEKAMEIALEARKKQNSDLNADVANDMRNLGRCLAQIGRTDEALARYKESEELFEKLNAQANIDYVGVLSDHGDLLLMQNRCLEADQLYEKTLATLKSTHNTDPESYVFTYERLRNVYIKLGRTAEAKDADASANSYKNGEKRTALLSTAK